MGELQDYSGALKPDLKMADFSKEALISLWSVTGLQYCALDGIWYNLIRERFGEELARELDAEAWRRQTPLEVRWTRQALNIWGNDVEAVMKWLQVDIGSGPVFPEFTCELKSKNVGVMTVKKCRGLDYFERHGETDLMINSCHVVDVEGFKNLARMFNPKMKCTPLKLPPRESPDDIACQWEFRLED